MTESLNGTSSDLLAAEIHRLEYRYARAGSDFRFTSGDGNIPGFDSASLNDGGIEGWLLRLDEPSRAKFRNVLEHSDRLNPVRYRVRSDSGSLHFAYDVPLKDSRTVFLAGPIPPEFQASSHLWEQLFDSLRDYVLIRDRGARPIWANASYFVCRSTPDSAAAGEFETSTRLLVGESGESLGTVSMLRDVTEQRREAWDYANSRAFLDSIIENIPNMIFLKDAEMLKFVRFNRAGESLLGLAREDLLGKSDYDLFPPDQAEFFCKKDREVLEERKLVDVPHESIRTSEGETRFLHTKKIPILDPAGNPLYLLGISEDITDRLRAEEELMTVHHDLERRVSERTAELEQANRELQSIYDSSPAGLACFDRELRCTKINASLAGLSGGTIGEIVGRRFTDFLPPGLSNALDPLLRRVLDGGGAQELEVHLSSGGVAGSGQFLQISCVPLTGTGGEVQGVNMVVIDFTARRRAEEALKAADKRKDEFLAMLAHELRNPLAPLRNAECVLRLGNLTDPVLCQARDIIGRQVGQMTRLVEDLLEVSRITRGKIKLQKRDVRVEEIVRSAVEAIQSLAEAKRQRLSVELQAQNVYLKVDPIRITQVLGNLLNNSVKYTNEGGEIRLVIEATESDVTIRVIDDGIGISAELLPNIFELFTQLDRSLDRAQGGLGIGLAVVHRLVELHGGTIEAKSAGLDRGSEFTVRFARSKPPEASAAETVAREAANRVAGSVKVLIVEDNVDSAESMAAMLRLLGYEVETVHDGIEALTRARIYRPEIVLCDIGLPGLNGYEVARQLRVSKESGSAILIAISGYGEAKDREQAMRAGFDLHFVKPIEGEVLERILASCRTSRPPEAGAELNS